MAVIATVGKVQGQVFAVDANGVKRALKEGDQIQEGETLITSTGSTVVLTFVNGNSTTIVEQQTLVVDTSVAGGPGGPDATGGGVAGTAPTVIPGGDPNQLLQDEATAAGLTGGGGSEGGTSFVQLLRLAELGGPGNEYAFNALVLGRPQDSTIAVVGDPAITTAPAQLTAANDAKSISEDTASVSEPPAGVLANDVGLSGAALTVTAVRTGTEAAGAGIAGTVGTALVGAFGTLTLNANGTYTYVLNNANAAVQALAPGDSVTDIFTYTVSDGTVSDRAELVITVNGTDDSPLAKPDTAAITEDAAPISGSVQPNDTPGDGTLAQNVFSLNSSPAGTYGSLAFNADGSYVYTLANASDAVQSLAAGQTVTDTFTYTLTDKDGDTSSASLVVTVTGVNDAPDARPDTNWVQASLIRGDIAGDGPESATAPPPSNSTTGNVILGGNHPGAPNGGSFADQADTDADHNTLTVTNAGSHQLTYGLLNLQSNGGYTYTQNVNVPQSLGGHEAVTDPFTYTVSDGTASTNGTLTMSVFGINDAPSPQNDSNYVLFQSKPSGGGDTTLSTATGNVLQNMAHSTLFQDVKDTDPDTNDTLSVTPSVLTGTFGTLTLSGDGSYSYAYKGGGGGFPGSGGTDDFSYTVTDGTASRTGTVSIHIENAPNANPDTNWAGGEGFIPEFIPEIGGPINKMTADGNVLLDGNHDRTVFFPASPGGSYSDKADTDPNGDAITVASFKHVGDTAIANAGGQLTTMYGTLTVAANGQYTYTLTHPPSGSGTTTDSFSYSITDGISTTTGALTITLYPTESVPT